MKCCHPSLIKRLIKLEWGTYTMLFMRKRHRPREQKKFETSFWPRFYKNDYLLNQRVFKSINNGLRPVLNLKLAEDIAYMRFHRF